MHRHGILYHITSFLRQDVWGLGSFCQVHVFRGVQICWVFLVHVCRYVCVLCVCLWGYFAALLVWYKILQRPPPQWNEQNHTGTVCTHCSGRQGDSLLFWLTGCGVCENVHECWREEDDSRYAWSLINWSRDLLSPVTYRNTLRPLELSV